MSILWVLIHYIRSAFSFFIDCLFFRYKCGICGDESITYLYMYSHVKAHNTDKCWEHIVNLAPNPQLETWLQHLISYQSSKIAANLDMFTESVAPEDENFQCTHCKKW